MKLSKYQHQEGILKDEYKNSKTRGNLRNRLIKWKTMKNKTVLDLGCNNGFFAIRAKAYGASKVLGVDKGDCIIGARELAKQKGLDVEFWQMDLESPEFQRFCPRFDMVFLFSVLTHLKDPEKFLDWLDSRVRRMLFFESNTGTKHKDQIELVKKHIWMSDVKYLGVSELPQNGVHHLWKCYRSYEEDRYSSWEKLPVIFVPINTICTWDNDFQLFPEKVEMLKEDMKIRGIRRPLYVYKLSTRNSAHNKLRVKGFEYKGVQGHHRYLAAKALGYKNIPVRILNT